MLRRRKRVRGKPWVHRGDGSLVGVLREYGTDQPISGATVSLRAAKGGPEALEVVTDAGGNLDTLGFSTDDQDGEGYLTEISEGDLDLAEFRSADRPRCARQQGRAGMA